MKYHSERDWSNIEKIKKLNSNFYSLIKAIPVENKKNLEILAVDYKFGEFIVSNESLNLPNTIKSRYAFGIVTKSALEVFTYIYDKIVPIAVLYPGQTFLIINQPNTISLPTNIKNITAGARSIFFLPKITDSMNMWRLARKHNLEVKLPKTYHDQWEIFKDLAVDDSWNAEILLFSEAWLSGKDLATKVLSDYINANELPNFDFFRKKYLFNMALAEVIKLYKGKTDNYTTDNVKHLFSIATGLLPGFVIANDESLAPIKLIKKAFIQDYRLRYTPHILQPGYCNYIQPCYYSMQIPTMLAPTFQQKGTKSKLNQLKDIHTLLSKTIDYLKSHNDNVIVQEILDFKNTSFKLFDGRALNDPKIDPSSYMKNFDAIIQQQIKLFKLPFSEASNFMSQGCISMIKKNKAN